MNCITIKNIYKAFGEKVVFENFSMHVAEGEMLVITGKSGAGKSTLLNMIGLLDKQDKGEIQYFDKGVVRPFTRQAENLLKYDIGYLFQNFALLEDQTVLYNMKLALEHHKIERKEEKIREALAEVGLQGYEDKKVYMCSGGEQQRISIARLLVKPCRLVLADEPTGSLDKENKEIIFRLLKQLQQAGKTLVIVTHDEELVQIADRVIKIN